MMFYCARALDVSFELKEEKENVSNTLLRENMLLQIWKLLWIYRKLLSNDVAMSYDINYHHVIYVVAGFKVAKR